MMNTRFSVFTVDKDSGYKNEFIYLNYKECDEALEKFKEAGVPAMICVSDEIMNGEISDILLYPPYVYYNA